MASVRRSSGIRVAWLALLLAAAPSARAVTTVSVVGPAALPLVGESFSVGIVVSGAADLYAFQFDFAFDPMLVSAAGTTEGPFLPAAGATLFIAGTIDNTTGAISMTADSLVGSVPGAGGDGTLATIGLTALGPGISPLTLSNLVVLDSAINEIDVEVGSGSVIVRQAGAVPEPPPFLPALLVVSAVVLALGRRSAIKVGRKRRW